MRSYSRSATSRCCRSEVLDLSFGQGANIHPQTETLLQGRFPEQLVGYRRVSFPRPANHEWTESQPSILRLQYRFLGTNRTHSVAVVPESPFSSRPLKDDLMRRRPNPQDFSFLRIDNASRTIHVKQGAWVVDKDLILPSGFRFVARPGTTLELDGSASILSRSYLDFRGEEGSPIVVRSSLGGESGLIVLETDEMSLLQYVVFEDLSVSRAPELGLTGAVTFYEAPVSIRNCAFRNSRAEDALNLIRSRFVISRTLFEQSHFDALDVDFSQGRITESSFVSSVGDALDLSDSSVSIDLVQIRGAGDKAISVGENSWLTGEEVRISDATVGVASKDLSRVDLEGLEISGAEIGLAVFQKKSEFGPASVDVARLQLEEVADPYWIEEASTATIDGELIKGTRKDGRQFFLEPDD